MSKNKSNGSWDGNIIISGFDRQSDHLERTMKKMDVIKCKGTLNRSGAETFYLVTKSISSLSNHKTIETLYWILANGLRGTVILVPSRPSPCDLPCCFSSCRTNKVYLSDTETTEEAQEYKMDRESMPQK